MKRTRMNFVVDAAAFAVFVFLLATGLLLRWNLPPGTGGMHTHAEGTVKSVWGLTRHEWGSIHFWVSAGLLGLLALHVVLHWNWIVAVIRGKQREGSGKRLALGAVALSVLLILSAMLLLAPITEEEGAGRAGTAGNGARSTPAVRDACHTDRHDIRGSRSLSEVAQKTGVPVAYLVERLGLPANTDIGQRLGRLRREYGFEIQDVRRIASEYRCRSDRVRVHK